jgi:hypothetical protein
MTVLVILLLLASPVVGQSVIERDGSIVVEDQSSEPQPLTQSGVDSWPTISPDGDWVAFRRTLFGPKVRAARGAVEPREIWIVRIDGRHARRLVPNDPNRECQNAMVDFIQLEFSADGRSLFFMTGCAMVNGCLHNVNLSTGRTRLVRAGVNGAEVVRNGRYAGNLLVQTHEYFKGGGSYEMVSIIRPNGRMIRSLGHGELYVENELVRRFKERTGRTQRSTRGAGRTARG